MGQKTSAARTRASGKWRAASKQSRTDERRQALQDYVNSLKTLLAVLRGKLH
jgi:hypothetical protein